MLGKVRLTADDTKIISGLIKPELLWGDKSDPQSDYPKCVLNRVLKECHTTACQDEFVKIAKAQNLDTVKERCPISFSDFAVQVKTLL